MTEQTIWVHKQSEVIVIDKPKGLMSALYDEYHHVDQLEQLQSENADLDTDNSLGLLQERIKELEESAKYFLAEYMDCAEKGRMSVDCDGAANALADIINNN